MKTLKRRNNHEPTSSSSNPYVEPYLFPPSSGRSLALGQRILQEDEHRSLSTCRAGKMMRRQKPLQGPQLERRTGKRFRAKDGALAFLGSSPGTIVDISEGGMAIHYIVFENEPAQRFQLDIFFGENDFYLAGIPSELVSDLQSPPPSPFSVVRVKRLGLRFGELTHEQKTRLKYFILHNTVAEA